jgi:hypothetical protein
MADRDDRGRFAPGNKLGPGLSSGMNATQAKLRHHFASLAQVQDLNKVYASMLDMAINCPEYKTRLAACSVYLDRCIGKVMEQMSLEVNNINPINDIPDAMARLRTLLNQTTPILPAPQCKVEDEESESA